MRRGTVVIAVAALVAAAAVAVAVVLTGAAGSAGPPAGAPASTGRARQARVKPATTYYLSLGDSLSRGVQPNSAGASLPTSQGYPEQLYAMLRPGDPGLRLVKLGCAGETTTTMIHGGVCGYPGGSQLAAATAFLRAHRGRVSLLTIDIGANDPDSCIIHPSFSKITTCIESAIPDTVGNLTKILRALRAAGGSKLRIIGMSYYVPELAEWRNGLAGQLIARLSERLAAGYNSLLTSVYTAAGARVADVSGAFSSGDFSQSAARPGFAAVPRSVALICAWTWECAPSPRGPNEHPNATGYRVIAGAFRRADSS